MPYKRSKHNWTEITSQFMLSDFEDFGTFARAMGLSPKLANFPEAKGIGKKKRAVIDELRLKIQSAILADPLIAREKKKHEVLSALETMGERLRGSIMARLNADAVATRAMDGESPETWAARVNKGQTDKTLLKPGDIMALAGAVHVADEALRRAVGLEDFDWEAEGRKAKLIAKVERKMQVEIVKTSNARSLDKLPVADEEKEA